MVGGWGPLGMLIVNKLGASMGEQLIPILTLDSYTSGNHVSLILTREKNDIKNCLLYYSGCIVSRLTGQSMSAIGIM